MKLLWDAPGVVDFIAAYSGHRDFGEHRAVAVVDSNGKTAAALVFHDWKPAFGVMEVSIVAVSPAWATRGVLASIGRYCFEDAGCQSIVARTDEGNERVRRLWKALGASEHIIPRLRGRAASEAILVLTAEAWAVSKFNRQAHEDIHTQAA